MSQSLPVPSMESCAALYSVFHCAGDKCSSDPNWGYDDSRGDYLTVVRLCCCCAHWLIKSVGTNLLGHSDVGHSDADREIQCCFP